MQPELEMEYCKVYCKNESIQVSIGVEGELGELTIWGR